MEIVIENVPFFIFTIVQLDIEDHKLGAVIILTLIHGSRIIIQFTTSVRDFIIQ